jgi:hypothetical protein
LLPEEEPAGATNGDHWHKFCTHVQTHYRYMPRNFRCPNGKRTANACQIAQHPHIVVLWPGQLYEELSCCTVFRFWNMDVFHGRILPVGATILLDSWCGKETNPYTYSEMVLFGFGRKQFDV